MGNQLLGHTNDQPKSWHYIKAGMCYNIRPFLTVVKALTASISGQTVRFSRRWLLRWPVIKTASYQGGWLSRWVVIKAAGYQGVRLTAEIK